MDVRPIIKRSCEMGFTSVEVEALCRPKYSFEHFKEWIKGQSVGICPDHGVVYWDEDVKRYTGQERGEY